MKGTGPSLRCSVVATKRGRGTLRPFPRVSREGLGTASYGNQFDKLATADGGEPGRHPLRPGALVHLGKCHRCVAQPNQSHPTLLQYHCARLQTLQARELRTLLLGDHQGDWAAHSAGEAGCWRPSEASDPVQVDFGCNGDSWKAARRDHVVVIERGLGSV